MKLFILILLLQLPSLSLMASCKQTLSRLDPTERLIAYLNTLLERRVITISNLEMFTRELRRSQIVNPIEESQTLTDSASLVHRAEVEKLLPKADRVTLLKWADKILLESQRHQETRDRARDNTADIHHKLKFHTISPQTILTASPEIKTDLVELFQISSTQITQKHWVDVMGENPSWFSRGSEGLQLDHPVERVTWWSAIVFANKMSEKEGLTPFYDLAGVQFDPNTRAEDGRLQLEKGEFIYSSEHVYFNDGYRLPTALEYYLLHQAIIHYNPDHWRQLDLHDWGPNNSAHTTHAVAQLHPVMVHGLPIFDFFGNVNEWTHSRSGGRFRVVYTGSFENQASSREEGPFFRYMALGFRLARSVKK